MSYPKYKYHEKEEPKLFNNALEEMEAGDEWYDSPVALGFNSIKIPKEKKGKK